MQGRDEAVEQNAVLQPPVDDREQVVQAEYPNHASQLVPGKAGLVEVF